MRERHDDDHHGHDDKDEHDKHDDDDHEGHGDDDKHGDHDEHHDDHAGDSDTHAGVFVAYVFTCDDVSKLDAISVNLMQRWSGFEEIAVQMIGPGGQALGTLNAQQSRLDLAQIQ